MTFGRDFAFVGNQYHLEKFGHDEYTDLLFYNRELMALVAVELKQGATYAKRWKRGKHPPFHFDAPTVSRTKHRAFRDEIPRPGNRSKGHSPEISRIFAHQKSPFLSEFRQFSSNSHKFSKNFSP